MFSHISLCDGALNNNSYDMFGEMKAACLLANSTCKSASAMTAEKVLEMATLGGARAIGRGHELGSIEPGKLADLVLVDLRRVHSYPIHDVVSNLVFTSNGGNVHTVFVNGRKVVEDGNVIGIDQAELLEQARARSETVRQQLGIDAHNEWPIS